MDEFFTDEEARNRTIRSTTREARYFRRSFSQPMDISHSRYAIQRQHTLLAIEEQYSKNEYALVWSSNSVPSGSPLRGVSGTVNISPVHPMEAPYLLRLIDGPEEQPRATRDGSTLRLTKSPPASGMRLLMMFGCQRIFEVGGLGVSYEIREPRQWIH